MAQFMMSMAPAVGGMQGNFAQSGSGNAQWTITPQERANYDTQFNNIQPVNGFLRGDQARNFFLQSNLPPPVLGQIWELADFTGDGKMDKLEFAIAMKLIKLKLQGVMLPMTLPASMKQAPGFGASPASSSSNLSRNNSINDGPSRSNPEWSVPKHSKLKYTQMFNTNDRTKSGYLSSMQARHVLSGTGLPQMTLAKIWQLSDIDNDGKLSQDEFILAMHLADTAKSGSTLPTTLPTHLIPTSYRSTTPPQPPASGQLGLLTSLNTMDVKLNDADNSIFTTFEDKRRDNFQKGNLELEKRRLALLESQQKERARIEQKEREQREKREKERMEQERKKQEQIERQLERQREAEREREEQKRKAIEQKEAAKREMERQRQLEWERSRRKELLQHKLREQDNVTSLRAKTKTLDVELSSHQEKRSQLQLRVIDVKSRVKEQSEQLNMVNKQRELKHTLVQKQQEQIELFNHQLNSLLPDKQNLNEKMKIKGNMTPDQSLQIHQHDYQSKVFTLQRLRTQLNETEAQKTSRSQQLEQLNAQLNRLREDLNRQMLAMESMNRIQQDKIMDLQEARRQKDKSLTRKNSMQENLRLMEKTSSAPLFHMQESETKFKPTDEMRRSSDTNEMKRREMEQRAEEERRRRAAAEEAERIRKQEEETKRRQEEEAKKAEVKRKIMEMQQERQKQKQQSNVAPASVPATSSSETAKPSHQGRGFQLVLSKDAAHLVKYRALYNFVARNPDELTINAGDTIVVDTSQDAEPDWLAGSKGNQSGWFPANYVEKLPGPAIKPPPQSAKPNYAKNAAASNALLSSQQSAFSATAKTPSNNILAKPPDIGQRYRAIYPWIAKKDNHLTFDKDDIVAVSEKQEMWWFGHCKGKSGWFPKSYVKETSSTTPINPNKPASPKSSPVIKRKAPAPPSGGKTSAKSYVATYAFTGTESGDLSFNTGDIIMVTNNDGEWWTGTLNGKTGIFPANYVDPHAAEPQTTTASLSKPEVATVIATYQASGPEQLSLQVGQVVSVRKRNESGWWEGELQARGKKKQIGWFPANYVKIMSAGGASGKSTPAEKIKVTKQEYNVMAVYDYSAQNSDELSFHRGAVITVTDKNDPDWWKGSLGGASGLFPSNYVEVVAANK